jgi:hypothetical protein
VRDRNTECVPSIVDGIAVGCMLASTLTMELAASFPPFPDNMSFICWVASPPFRAVLPFAGAASAEEMRANDDNSLSAG